ncbi:MAG TPA: DNA topoisomerase IB [Propionicimonas sp.]|nr:DNA topoisomerase IB [Propionicimonas sp.]HRA07534.1 DNA topoisomerase IB [Propionicimonas sp.]
MPRLRRVSPAAPGWRRRRSGRGFSYFDENGRLLGGDEVERVRALVIPPAWRDVWICPLPNGHLQATGLDAAGRRQYLYHPKWRERQDRLKFDRVATAAVRLQDARGRVEADLARPGMPLERAAAVAVRLLDLGYFRIGNDYYTDANGSFGLTTLERHHVRRNGDALVFRFVGKSGIEHTISIADPDAIAALQVMRRRRDDSPRLLAYRSGPGWLELASTNVNAYLSELFGGELTAKDFRTWHATVIAAETLALAPAKTATARKQAVKAAVNAVSGYLGNTPTIARNSYIDPRVIDLYESGATIASITRRSYAAPAQRQAALERAVLELLGES